MIRIVNPIFEIAFSELKTTKFSFTSLILLYILVFTFAAVQTSIWRMRMLARERKRKWEKERWKDEKMKRKSGNDKMKNQKSYWEKEKWWNNTTIE